VIPQRWISELIAHYTFASCSLAYYTEIDSRIQKLIVHSALIFLDFCLFLVRIQEWSILWHLFLWHGMFYKTICNLISKKSPYNVSFREEWHGQNPHCCIPATSNFRLRIGVKNMEKYFKFKHYFFNFISIISIILLATVKRVIGLWENMKRTHR